MFITLFSLKNNQWSRTYVSFICFILLHVCYLYSIHWLMASKGSLSIRRFWGKQGRKKRQRERVTWKERNAFLSRPPPPPPPHSKISSSLTPKEGLILKLSKESAFYWHRIILFRFSIIQFNLKLFPWCCWRRLCREKKITRLYRF